MLADCSSHPYMYRYRPAFIIFKIPTPSRTQSHHVRLDIRLRSRTKQRPRHAIHHLELPNDHHLCGVDHPAPRHHPQDPAAVFLGSLRLSRAGVPTVRCHRAACSGSAFIHSTPRCAWVGCLDTEAVVSCDETRRPTQIRCRVEGARRPHIVGYGQAGKLSEKGQNRRPY